MAKTAIIIFADGFEEIEAVTPADILRRAGVEVALVGLEAMEVRGAHGIVFKMDRLLGDEENIDAIILPGGLPGAENLAASEKLANILKHRLAAGELIAAICASPGLVLGQHGIMNHKQGTCYPGFESHFGDKARYIEKSVVIDGNVITSRGPGTAFAFGLALARELAGGEIAEQLQRGMLSAG